MAPTRAVPLNVPSPMHLALAERLLAHEGAPDDGVSSTPVRSVYDKLEAELTPLLGAAGVELLFVRSAKLAGGELAVELDARPMAERATWLRTLVQNVETPMALDVAAVLFGTFFALVTTFIGDRLTTQVLRHAWPTLDKIAPPGDKL